MNESSLHHSILKAFAYQPLIDDSGFTVVLLRGPRALENTKTDLTEKSVGCTSRSASPQVPSSGEASARPAS